MSGVTNRLIDAAHQAKRGDREAGKTLGDALRRQHFEALAALVPDEHARLRVECRIEELLAEGMRLYEGTALLRELTLRTLDAISSLGERLCAPVFAAALSAMGIAGVAVEATELIVTDSFHAGAPPQPEPTPLRSDPRLVAEARTIPEISYREAAELAYFGARVLHPTTLRPVMPTGIPVWIRNSFAPDKPGTKITQQGRSIGGGVKALTAIRDVALISIGGPGILGLPDVGGRTFSTTAPLRAEGLLISQSSSHNYNCFFPA